MPVQSAAQVAEVGRLAEEIWLEHYPPIIGLAQTRHMLEHLQSPTAIAGHIARGARYFLLQHAERHVGYAAIEAHEESSTLFISKLYVLRDARGLGLGQRALEPLAALARAEGLGRLELTVNKNNALALRCYARFGMTIEGTRVVDIGGGHVMDDYVLVMQLAAA
ncbi:MAG: GNAT family N-acetyltransferase, partial [Deltaproteobacteria bacterium]|nr:GNAT family N-acetyltransferase [Deltaproteobacteria bacterium]